MHVDGFSWVVGRGLFGGEARRWIRTMGRRCQRYGICLLVLHAAELPRRGRGILTPKHVANLHYNILPGGLFRQSDIGEGIRERAFDNPYIRAVVDALEKVVLLLAICFLFLFAVVFKIRAAASRLGRTYVKSKIIDWSADLRRMNLRSLTIFSGDCPGLSLNSVVRAVLNRRVLNANDVYGTFATA